MNRADLARELLFRHGTITMGFVADNHRDHFYTFRNAIAELKKELLAEGYTIHADHSGPWRDHSYTLVKVEPPADSVGLMSCVVCGGPFEARERDVKAGNGRFCSRKCAGRYGGRLSRATRANGQASRPVMAAQRALL